MERRTDIAAETAAARMGSVGWQVQRVARRFESAMTEALRAEELTLAQFAILMSVTESDGQTQTEIGAGFSMPPWQISRALDGLQALGLIERRACTQSRRVHRIHATEAALTRAPGLRAVIAAVNAQVLAPLADTERAALSALLRQLLT